MSITNTSKPSTSLTNTSRVSFAELWSTISTTWATETRTWLDCSSLMDNTAKRTFGSYAMSEVGHLNMNTFPNVTFDTPFNPFTNTSKP